MNEHDVNKHFKSKTLKIIIQVTSHNKLFKVMYYEQKSLNSSIN